MAASSSLTTRFEHDVYLSFRGEDVRDFIDRLYEALLDDKIKTFMDDELARGEETLPPLLHVIEKSKISVVVFSENYASSKSFLEELEKILGCRRSYGQVVIPVYYHVDPVDVKNQTGSFGHGFSRVEERYMENPERLTRWRDALKEAANISGFSADAIRPDEGLVEDIVKDILKKLPDISPEYELASRSESESESQPLRSESELQASRSESESQALRSESESQALALRSEALALRSESESQALRSESESQALRLLSVFFLVMEAILVVLDIYGRSKKNFLLASFVLSAFGFTITIYAFIRKRSTPAYQQRAERELAWVEFAFSVLQLVTLFIQYILAVARVKNSYSPSLFALVFALLVVVFAFKKKSEALALRSESESQALRLLSVLFLVMEAILVVLDIYGRSKKNFLLSSFVLSAFGFTITIYAFIRKRSTPAYQQRAERELAWVEVAFSVLQLVTLFIQYILAVARVKNSYSPSLFALVFALLVVVFAFKKKQISHSQEQVVDP